MNTARASLIPGFRLYSILQMVSTICTGIQCTILPVFVVQQMGSDKALADLALAALGITTAMPLVILVIGGPAADYYNRWSILLISQAAALVQALALGLVALNFSPGTHNLRVLAMILPLNMMASIITPLLPSAPSL